MSVHVALLLLVNTKGSYVLPAAPPAAPSRKDRLPVVQRAGVDRSPAAATLPAGPFGAACFVATCAVPAPHPAAATATSPSDTSCVDLMATSRSQRYDAHAAVSVVTAPG